MNRREIIVAAAVAAVAGTAIAAPGKEGSAVVEACYACMKTGELCLAMCNDMLGHGMTKLADCQKRVADMLTLCEAMGTMAARSTAPTARLRALATMCADTCRDCEKACRPNTDMAECKACMEDAVKCAKACDAFAKA